MMNIPSYYSAYDLSVRIDQKFNIDSKKENRFYNYIYVPGSRKTLAQNVGFAFINFMHPKHIIKFYEYYQNRKLKTNTNRKINRNSKSQNKNKNKIQDKKEKIKKIKIQYH